MINSIWWKSALLLGTLAVASCGQDREAARQEKPSTADDSVASAQESPVEADRHIAVEFPEAPGGGMIVQKNVMVPMRDGVRLATDIYRPSGADRYPVVLVRSPYGSETPEVVRQAQYYVKQGYVFAIQDCRGKYDSEGDWYGKRDEGKDGSDAITWLGTRPWSSGKVGMTGGSYLGMVQYLVADQENPYLKALVPMVAPTTLGREISDYDHIAGYGGRESTSNIIWMMRTDGRVNQSDENLSLTFEKAWDHLPRSDYPKVFGKPMEWVSFLLNQHYGFYEEYFLRAAQGEWRKPIDMEAWLKGYEERYRRVNVPMLHISGWYDCCGEQLIKTFQLVRQYAAAPVGKSQQLIMGPWIHAVGRQKNGDYDFGPTAKMDPDEVSVKWFDHWLKGEENGVDKQPAVRVFVMNENRWREAGDWPIPGTRFTRFYLHSRGAATLSRGGGGLSIEAPGDEPVDRYTYDPANPTPVLNPFLGPWDMAAVEQRDDTLVYTSESLESAVEVTGPLAATLYVSTSAPSTDFFVRLIDVHANGKAYPMFYQTASPYRTHWSKEVEQTPEGARIVKADIALPATSVLFQKGHRIRVEITSSAAFNGSNSGLKRFGFRGLNVEPGTEATATRWNVAQQTIYHDRAHPSHILLPIVPRGN